MTKEVIKDSTVYSIQYWICSHCVWSKFTEIPTLKEAREKIAKLLESDKKGNLKFRYRIVKETVKHEVMYES